MSSSSVATRWPRSARRLLPPVLLVPLLGAVSLAGCGGEEDTSLVSATVPASAPAPTSTAPAPEPSDEDQISDLVARWHEVRTAAVLSNSYDPDLVRSLVRGPARRAFQDGISARLSDGTIAVAPTPNPGRSTMVDVEVRGTRATAVECSVDALRLVEVETGRELDDAITTYRRSLDLIRIETGWVIEKVAVLDKRTGVAPCDA